MQLIGLARLGRDAEARTVGENVVANLSLAFDYYDPKSNDARKRSTTCWRGWMGSCFRRR